MQHSRFLYCWQWHMAQQHTPHIFVFSLEIWLCEQATKLRYYVYCLTVFDNSHCPVKRTEVEGIQTPKYEQSWYTAYPGQQNNYTISNTTPWINCHTLLTLCNSHPDSNASSDVTVLETCMATTIASSFPPVVLWLNMGHGLLILEVSRSQTATHHSR